MSDKTLRTMTLAEAMNSRHAVRQYKSGLPMPEQDLHEILELAASAPSSWNLQHWRFLVVTEQSNKDRLLPITGNQQQVAECSAVIIVLGDLEADRSAEAVYRPSLEAGQLPQRAYDTLMNNIKEAYSGSSTIPRDEANRNAALAAMQLMLAAKAKGYDTCPMGGFDREQLKEALHIPDRYLPVMMITLGRADAPAHETARFPLEQLIIRESF